MAAVTITAKDYFTNLVEYTGATMDALDDWIEVPAESASYTFAAVVTGTATFKLALECSFNGNGNWFTIDTAKTINSAGTYVYFYDGKPASRIRMRISQVDSGTPDVVPHIAVAYHG
jgi:hypothetical protein